MAISFQHWPTFSCFPVTCPNLSKLAPFTGGPWKLPHKFHLYLISIIVYRVLSHMVHTMVKHLDYLWLSKTTQNWLRTNNNLVINPSQSYQWTLLKSPVWQDMSAMRISLSQATWRVVYLCIIFFRMHSIFALPGWRHECILQKVRVSHFGPIKNSKTI